MTIRTIINKKKRIVNIITCIGFIFFGIGIFINEIASHLLFIPLIGFAVFFSGIVYTFFGIKCPKCNGKLGYISNYLGTLFSIAKEVRYCPFCGVDIDTELKK